MKLSLSKNKNEPRHRLTHSNPKQGNPKQSNPKQSNPKQGNPAQSRFTAPFLAGVLLFAGLAGAQIVYSKLNLAGQQVESVTLYGAEYVSEAALRNILTITREGGLVKVAGMGHTLFLPIDEDNQRATTDFNQVQLDTDRIHARAATFVNNTVYLPLDTLARGLGAQYEQGSFTVAEPKLLRVSSRVGKESDRLVLDLSRDIDIADELRGASLVVTLKNVKGDNRKYTTKGAFISTAEVKKNNNNLILTIPVNAASGTRVYKVIRSNSVRVVVDIGPGIPRYSPEMLDRVTRPLIVLDPNKVQGVSRDVTLEVARRAAELLSKAGWQVQVTRDTKKALTSPEALKLARQSDVYLSLDMGRFPQSTRSGVTVYEQTGRASTQIVNAIRNGQSAPYSTLIVGDNGGTRRLSELLRGELKGGGITAQTLNTSRVLSLSEAPQAALMLEIGWANNAQDLARLGVDRRLQAMAVAVARSIATYLTARANNNANLGANLGAITTQGGQ